jgi:hypothetical protein
MTDTKKFDFMEFLDNPGRVRAYVYEMEAEIERLTDHRDALQGQVKGACDTINRVLAALEWYANAGDYERSIDCGERARKALLSR